MSRPISRLLTGWPARIIGALIVAIVVLSVSIPLYVTSRSDFLGQYASLKKAYTTLESSGHSGLACNECHVGTRGKVAYRAALVGDFYRSVAGRPKAPVFVKMAKPPREACLKCHDQDWSDNAARTLKIPHPAHLRVAAEKRDCVTCHRWTAHEEEYMQKHKTMKFSGVCASYGCHVGTKQAKDCKSCHHTVQQDAAEWTNRHPKVVRTSGPNSCLESCHEADQCRQCHTTGKRPDFGPTASPTGVKAIEREHVKQDWLSKHGNLALADESKCLECHVSVGECEDCHSKRPASHGLKSTWIGRHKDLAKDKRRCLACHQENWCEDCHRQFKEMR